MSRCRESAGLLFPRPCREAATGACRSCQRPVCAAHARDTRTGPQCVSCIREAVKDRRHRGTYAHLEEDPLFHWFFHAGDWFDDSFTEGDYALFDEPGGTFDAAFESDWAGS